MEPRLNARVGVIAVTLWIGLGAVLSGVGGDDPSRVSLYGMVKVDGAPLESGTVYFRIISPSANLVTGGAMVHHGRFALPESDPIVPGTYEVRISGLDTLIPRELLGVNTSVPPESLPECYNSKTILQVQIPRGGKQYLTFELKR